MELLVVLVLLGLLAGLVAPVVTGSIGRAKEAALRDDLHVFRKAIDDYYADNGHYPPTLDVLVKRHYLHSIPNDPVAEQGEKHGWHLVYVQNGKGISDVHSWSHRWARDGSRYDTW